MATKTWLRGTDFASLPATVTSTAWPAANFQEHTPPAGATDVTVVNNAAVVGYVSIGHTLADNDALDTTKSVEVAASGGSVTIPLVGVDGQVFTGAALRKFYTVGANITLIFGCR